MKKGEIKNRYSYTEEEIARAAGISVRALRVAKARKVIVPSDLKSVIQYVVEHWIRQIRTAGAERCVHRHTRKEHPQCFGEER